MPLLQFLMESVLEFGLSASYDGRMKRRLMIFCGAVLGAVALAGCQARPSETVDYGETLQTVHFDHDHEWENYVNPAQKVEFQVEDGAFHVRAWDGGFTWALNSDVHTDVVIQADVEQLSDYADNAFGLMCRASPTNNGDGYFFFISGDGFYTFRRGASKEVLPIIPWTSTDAIQQGRSINRIRIVCVDDYLALYVNGQFVAEARDNLFKSGYTGLTAAVPKDGEVDVKFDDVVIRAATLEGHGAAATNEPG
ncbi:MAG: hypothetical protein U0452_07045 [Anaerolineae bacterium]